MKHKKLRKKLHVMFSAWCLEIYKLFFLSRYIGIFSKAFHDFYEILF